jgi:hypothetical protein
MAASMLPPDLPGSGALRALLAALWSMAERLRSAVFACGFGHMLEGQCGVFLWAGGWGRVHQGLKYDEGTESSLFSPLG